MVPMSMNIAGLGRGWGKTCIKQNNMKVKNHNLNVEAIELGIYLLCQDYMLISQNNVLYLLEAGTKCMLVE